MRAALLAEVPFQVQTLRMFGREVPEPRCSAWVGDPAAVYTYSGRQRAPLNWTPTLLELRARLATALGVRFNSVLCNLYRDGRDAMGLHADDEPELGPQPLIASLSLGETRKMRFVAKKRGAGLAAVPWVLSPGSLLIMGGKTQALYKHGVARTKAVCGPRLNLTFRCVGFGRAGGQCPGRARL